MNPKLKKKKRDSHPDTYSQTGENVPDFKTYHITP